MRTGFFLPTSLMGVVQDGPRGCRKQWRWPTGVRGCGPEGTQWQEKETHIRWAELTGGLCRGVELCARSNCWKLLRLQPAAKRKVSISQLPAGTPTWGQNPSGFGAHAKGTWAGKLLRKSPTEHLESSPSQQCPPYLGGSHRSTRDFCHQAVTKRSLAWSPWNLSYPHQKRGVEGNPLLLFPRNLQNSSEKESKPGMTHLVWKSENYLITN